MAERAPSPWRILWRRYRHHRLGVIGGWILAALYLLALLANLVAPYAYDHQFRELSFHPPMAWPGTYPTDEELGDTGEPRPSARLRFRDAEGALHLVPFVYDVSLEEVETEDYLLVERVVEDTSRRYPLRLFVKGDPYELLGFLSWDRHLVGVEAPANLFLLGTDIYGRDVLSRILVGSQISLSVGLVGIAITISLGMLAGGVAGYYKGKVDFALMRLVEIILAIPSLYLILVLRTAFPVDLSSTATYLLIVVILAFVGWASVGRVIRGLVLSISELDFVTAAEALGVSRFGIIVRHILPNTLSFVIVTATLFVPYYILGEVALSFLGIGIQEPQSSWGLMLKDAQHVTRLQRYPWILAPGFFIFVTVLAFNFLGDALRDAADPKTVVRVKEGA